jgi:uncharacterized membrane protein YciS (DUF1049 family)
MFILSIGIVVVVFVTGVCLGAKFKDKVTTILPILK